MKPGAFTQGEVKLYQTEYGKVDRWINLNVVEVDRRKIRSKRERRRSNKAGRKGKYSSSGMKNYQGRISVK